MKTWTKRQYLTYILLFAFLLLDFSQALFFLIVRDLLDPSVVQIYTPQLRILAGYLNVFQWLGSFPIIIFILKVNRDRLQEMNIDRFYMLMLVTAGMIPLYKSPYIFPYNFLAVISFTALIYAVYILFSNTAKFAIVDRNSFLKTLLIIGTLAGIIFWINGFIHTVIKGVPNIKLSDTFVFQQIPGLIYEEAMYRGVLYMFLMDVGVSKPKAFFIQAFWFSGKHIHLLLAFPFFYWIIFPILSLTFGYIVMRSKSLTLSAFAHLLYSTYVEFAF